MDKYDKQKRSEIMASVRSKNTAPELTVQHTIDELGLEFDTHRSDLPGKPDIVLHDLRLAIMIHGCFWHHHQECGKGGIPKSHKSFWRKKIHANIERDKRNASDLKKLGWTVLVLWECEIKNDLARGKLMKELSRRVFLNSNSALPDEIYG